tara:strand:+ start:1174 stop:1683 length:510 start_codon:yes stop_codon:yes gene_type:complete
MQDLYYDVFESSWGWVAVCGAKNGIKYATLPEPTLDRAIFDLESVMRKPLPELEPGKFETFKIQLEEYFAGKRKSWDVKIDTEDATEFFRRAWEACITIPFGETRSYKWLALAAGNIAASRGAGQAMARNRIPLIIPCHRVIGEDGELHGFGGPGLTMKKRLLELESTN